MVEKVDVARATRASLLRMAQNWYQLGKTNQAVDTYLRVVTEHPGTNESEKAKTALISIASVFEGEGRYHLAIDIYDRLGQASA
jgi:hypothetical protein